jgi:penicillin-binding protein 1A
MDYELRQVYRGPEAYVDLPAPTPPLLDARIAEALADHPDNDDLRAAVVLEASPARWWRCCSRATPSPSPATA